MKRLAILAVGVLLAGLAGCALEEEDKKSEQKPIRRTTTGGVFAGDVDDLANLDGQRKRDNRQNDNPQVPDLVNANRNPNVAVNDGHQPVPASDSPARFTERRVAGKEGIVGVVTDRVVDYKVAIRQKPQLREVQNRTSGGDPLSVLAGAYVSASSRISMLNFKNNLRIAASANGGRYPTYKQYIDVKKKLRVELAKLPSYQVYAYKEDKGELVILEDPDLKAKNR